MAKKNKPIKRGAPPTVMTPEVIRLLENAFAAKLNVLEACNYAGIGKTAYYEFLKKRPDVADRFELLKTSVSVAAKFNMADSIIKKKNLDDSRWWLSTVNKDEFSTKVENETTHKTPVPVTIMRFSDFPIPEMDQKEQEIPKNTGQ